MGITVTSVLPFPVMENIESCSLGEGQTQRLHGRMPKEESRQLSKLLGSAELRNPPVNHGGLIRHEAEIFAAEIPSGEPEAWCLQWLNADGENPFPPSVSKLMLWLQRFQPKDGKCFEYTEYPDVSWWRTSFSATFCG